MKPKIVEDHAGSSDITQSTDAKVIEMIKSPRPGPLTICKRLGMVLSGARSCSSDHRFNRNTSKNQNMKKIPARIKKKDTFRYFTFICRPGDVFMKAALVHG